MPISNKEQKLQDYYSTQESFSIPVKQDENDMKQNLVDFSELPYAFNGSEYPLEASINELLLDGYVDQLHHSDGLIGFHHLKYVTSNAKRMSQWFQMTMGFEEIAYKGLETGSNILCSHVIRNGKVVIELTSTLQATDKNPTLFPIDASMYVPEDEQKDMDQFLKYNKIILDMFESIVKSTWCSNLIVDQETTNNLLYKIHESPKFTVIKKDFENILKDLQLLSTFTIQDLMDSFTISNYLKYHGEGVMDVSFCVTDVDKVFQKAILGGALIIKKPGIIHDVHGIVKTATLGIPNTDMRHTLIECDSYKGAFLPGYEVSSTNKSSTPKHSDINLQVIDHCVENYTWNQMDHQVKLYAKMFGFHKFWSVDDTVINTSNSSLNSTVMSSANGKIKIPINEPSESKYKGQIEEFYDFNGGPGVQHIALRTHNIIETVIAMKKNGIQFNSLSSTYYDNLAARLKQDDIVLLEDFKVLKSLDILIDYDASTRNPTTKKCNYLLQIFANPMTDRPTLFFEIIQRHHHNGFGKGTFKGLYESIERDQMKRGTLIERDTSK